jgi:thiol-disulfide isomerase/thioredoxin
MGHPPFSLQEVVLTLLRAFAVALVTACSLLGYQTEPQTSQAIPQPGEPAPDFTLADSTGLAVKLSAYKGKVVLLDFWATWCRGLQSRNSVVRGVPKQIPERWTQSDWRFDG